MTMLDLPVFVVTTQADWPTRRLSGGLRHPNRRRAATIPRRLGQGQPHPRGGQPVPAPGGARPGAASPRPGRTVRRPNRPSRSTNSIAARGAPARRECRCSTTRSRGSSVRTVNRIDVGDHVAYVLEPVATWAPESSDEDLLYLSDIDDDRRRRFRRRARPRVLPRPNPRRRGAPLRPAVHHRRALGLVVVVAREAAALREQREHHVVELLRVTGGLVDRRAPDVAVRRHPQRPRVRVRVLAHHVGFAGDRTGRRREPDRHRLLRC